MSGEGDGGIMWVADVEVHGLGKGVGWVVAADVDARQDAP